MELVLDMKITKFILVMLVAACSVNCNVTSSCSQEDIYHSYLNVAVDMISKAKYYIPSRNNITKAVDCADILHMGHNKSGIYEIWPMNRIFGGKSFYAYCDMDTDGGGWTVIQRRGDFQRPKDYFYRNWETYRKGFGNIEEDFWLGNDKIFALSNQKMSSVRFDLRDVIKDTRYAVYDEFWIDDEKRNYTLHIDYYKGDAGDAMIYHNYNPFSTFDHEISEKCTAKYKGGWWYYCSHRANLNGLYYKGKNGNSNYDGLSWDPWKGPNESLEWTEIKIRPKQFRAMFP